MNGGNKHHDPNTPYLVREFIPDAPGPLEYYK